MKLLDIKTLLGPNYWSVKWQNIIEAKVDIEELEELPTNKIEGFPERLFAAMPSLNNHFCSEGHKGGFLKRVKEGTWMAHVVEHIALELQYLAGMECTFGRTRSSEKKGVYYVALSYQLPEAGRYALHAALTIAQHLIDNKEHDISKDIEELKEIKAAKDTGVSTKAILAEAKERGIPYRKMNEGSMYILGQGINQRRISASIACSTSGIGIDTACDKESTKRILDKAYIPVPEGDVVISVEQLKECVDQLGFPLTIKPLDGNHGKGVSVNIRTEEDAIVAFHKAITFSGSVIVERFIEGSDFRLLVINNKFVAAANRIPAMVTGNNRSTIKELVEELNKDPNRGNGHAKALTQIKIDINTETILAQKGLTLDSIPSEGEIIYLKSTANLSTGGTSVDVTDIVHPDCILLAERVSRLIDLDICGIDVVAKDITKPLAPDNGCVIEVNACPGLRMHLNPTEGKARNVAEPIVSMLFPEGRSSRIPLIAVTGTNGKTTTTRLIAYMAKLAGQTVGYTTTDGIYINDEVICRGDCTGYSSTELVLTDPVVDFAVVECARGGILRTGLGFDQCDTSVITNVAEDHLGLDGINSLDDMAKIKSVVAESTSRDGFTILNAEDDKVFDMGDYVECNIALFALDPENERIDRHCKRGGLSAVIEEGHVVVKKGNWSTVICSINEIPLTFSGRAECMIKNVLAAVLAATVHNFDTHLIRRALTTFYPSPENTPGRFNIFKIKKQTVMVDYAHNPHAMIELKKFISKTYAPHKIGIITAPGDRRDEDIIKVGYYAAQMFDEIIIRLDEDLRGRPAQELTRLLRKGILSFNQSASVSVIASEEDAILHALETSMPGTFITTLTEKVWQTIELLKTLTNKEPAENIVRMNALYNDTLSSQYTDAFGCGT